jgi:ferredoxin-thioredoxin reductase catalytic subunit
VITNRPELEPWRKKMYEETEKAAEARRAKAEEPLKAARVMSEREAYKLFKRIRRHGKWCGQCRRATLRSDTTPDMFCPKGRALYALMEANQEVFERAMPDWAKYGRW